MNFGTDMTKAGSCQPPSGGKALAPVFFRSFLLQAAWNYERFQNLGFVFSMLPALRRAHAPGAPLNSAVLRHLAQFNTQPYMAGFVMGNIIRMEESVSGLPVDEAMEKKMLSVKTALASGFAAIGDRLFWGRLKPLMTQLCVLVWACGGFYGWLFRPSAGTVPAPSMALLFGGPLAGMAVYASFSVYLRWTGLKRGYACGGSSSCGLDAFDWPRLIRRLSAAGFALAAAAALSAFAFLLFSSWSGAPDPGFARKVAPVLAALAIQRAARKSGRSIFFATGMVIAVSLALVALFGPEGWAWNRNL